MRITIRLDEELQAILDKLPGSSTTEKIKMALKGGSKFPKATELAEKLQKKEEFIIAEALNDYERKSRGKIIPKNKWTKNEIAEFLQINPLSKEYALFMDNVEKVYYN